MRIIGVINNNFLRVVNDSGQELIVSGKGLGFQRKRGETLDPQLVEKTYQMLDAAAQRKLAELIAQIPMEHIELTQELIEYIQKNIAHPLNETILITLADHISFAIKRMAEGLVFQSPLTAAVMTCYAREYHLGQDCIRIIGERCNCFLPDDEAATIALHIINAELNTNMTEVYNITTLLEEVIRVVEFYYKKEFDRSSLNFDRFCIHLRFFGQRLFSDSILTDSGDENDGMFRQLVAQTSKKHYKCAQQIANLVRNKYHKELSEEELIYLTIHLRRINNGG